jgi:hypothetical protein
MSSKCTGFLIKGKDGEGLNLIYMMDEVAGRAVKNQDEIWRNASSNYTPWSLE